MALLNTRQLKAKIKSIGSQSNKMRGIIHEVLVSCAFHSAKDGQITPFNDLLEAVGNGTRKAGIVMWAETYGFVRYEKGVFLNNKESRKGVVVTNEADFAEYKKIMDTSPHWADMVKPEPVKSIFDVSKYLSNVLAKLAAEGSDDVVPYIERAIAEYNVALELKVQAEALAELASNDAELALTA